MMKKFLCFLLLLNTSFVFAAPNQSTNEFPLMLETSDIPAGGGEGKNSGGGLSGGAVTAITLGSIGGAALGGIAYLIYKNQGLCANAAFGSEKPLCVDKVSGKISICENLIRKKSFDTIVFEIPEGKNGVKITQINSDNNFLDIDLYLDNNMNKKNKLKESMVDMQTKTKVEYSDVSNSKTGTLIVVNKHEDKKYSLILEFY